MQIRFQPNIRFRFRILTLDPKWTNFTWWKKKTYFPVLMIKAYAIIMDRKFNIYVYIMPNQFIEDCINDWIEIFYLKPINQIGQSNFNIDNSSTPRPKQAPSRSDDCISTSSMPNGILFSAYASWKLLKSTVSFSDSCAAILALQRHLIWNNLYMTRMICHTTQQPLIKEAGHATNNSERRIPLRGSQVWPW